MTMPDLLLVALGIAAGMALSWAFFANKLARARQLLAKAGTELAVAASYSSGLKERLDSVVKEKEEMSAYRDKALTLDAQKSALDQRLMEQQQELEKMQSQLKLEFKNTAATLFEEISKKFSTNSEKQIGDLLNPLKERLGEFQKMVGESFSTQGKEQHTLKAEIERIVNMNEAMRLETNNLTRALRGDVKAQGNWGEVILERILEESGLQRDEDYILQGAGLGLIDSDGGRQQPDVIVKLPDHKHIIVDAKVSLVSYERYCAAEGDARMEHLRDFLKSVRSHVNGLEQKKYQHNEKMVTPDFVLMFMPVEGAYSLAVQSDSELHTYAWGKKIVLVCPSTLFATLRTVSSLWKIERQNKNAAEIAKRAGDLYDQFIAFTTDMKKIEGSLKNAQDSYDSAFKRLREGRGVTYQIEKLKALGAKTSKSLSNEFLTDELSQEEGIQQAVEG